MGLLKHLLFWPVTGPQFLIEFSLGKVNDTVRDQLTDDQLVKEDLLALQMRLELGDIDDEQYVEEEAALMRRLREVREWREEFGMGISGGPVRVRREPGDGNDGHAPAGSEDEPSPEGPAPGGIASPDGASVDLRLDWE